MKMYANRLTGLVLAVATAGLLSACVSEAPKPKERNSDVYSALSPAVADAASGLVKQLGDKVDKKKPLVVATIVNVDDLNKSSSFGRTVSELLTARLAGLGYTVRDVKLRKSYAIREKKGEFALSRKIEDLNDASVVAQGFVTGSYAAAGDRVYVSLRVIRATDGEVFAGSDFELKADRTVKSLLDPKYYWIYRMEEGLRSVTNEERRLQDGESPGIGAGLPTYEAPNRPDVPLGKPALYHEADDQLTFVPADR